MDVRKIVVVCILTLITVPAVAGQLTPPTGLDALDPWVDAQGDSMVGDLDMGPNAVILGGAGLIGNGTNLSYGANDVCLIIGNCFAGDITGVYAGFGLLGGGEANDVTLSADASVLQLRVSDVCMEGYFLRSIAENGTVACAADADTDTLGALACAAADIAKWNGTVWQCGPDVDTDTDTLAGLVCGADGIARWNGTMWVCSADNDTTYAAGEGLVLGDGTFALIGCADGEVLKASGGSWSCGTDVDTDTDTDTTYAAGNGLALAGTTFALTGCAEGQLLQYTGGSWVCADISLSDTLAGLSCAAGQVAKWGGTAWACAADADTTYVAGPGLSLTGNIFVNAGDLDGGDDVLVSTVHGGDLTGTYDALQIGAASVGATELANGAVLITHLSGMGCLVDQVLKSDGTGWACAPDEGDNPDADLLDGLDSLRFLRSDTDDDFTGSRLTIAPGSVLDVAGEVKITSGGPSASKNLCFESVVVGNCEQLLWSAGGNEFRLSDDLVTTGTTTATHLNSNGNIFLNRDGPEASSFLCFFELGDVCGESLAWEDAEGRFQFTDRLLAAGTIEANVPTGTPSVAYNRIGTLAPTSSETTTANDMHVSDDLSTGGTGYFGSTLQGSTVRSRGTMYVNHDGPDGSFKLCWWDAGAECGQSLGWNDAAATFESTSGLDAAGVVKADSLSSRGNVLVNSDGPDGDAIVCFYRFGVPCNKQFKWDEPQNRFEVNDDLDALGTASASEFRSDGILYANYDGPDGNTFVCFYEIGPCGRSLAWDDSQNRFELDDQLATQSALDVGSLAGTPVAYNRFGTGTPATGDMNTANDVFVTFDLEIGQDAYKPGGGDWIAPSDLRLKQDVHPFEDGLATIRGIDPVWYTYNGLGGLPADATFVGVIAQDAAKVMPYAVEQQALKLSAEDATTTDVNFFDPSALDYIQVNAIQELDAEVARLSAENSDLQSRLAALEVLVQQLLEKS